VSVSLAPALLGRVLVRQLKECIVTEKFELAVLSTLTNPDTCARLSELSDGHATSIVECCPSDEAGQQAMQLTLFQTALSHMFGLGVEASVAKGMSAQFSAYASKFVVSSVSTAVPILASILTPISSSVGNLEHWVSVRNSLRSSCTVVKHFVSLPLV
jgi:hypothetical protein